MQQLFLPNNVAPLLQISDGKWSAQTNLEMHIDWLILFCQHKYRGIIICLSLKRIKTSLRDSQMKQQKKITSAMPHVLFPVFNGCRVKIISYSNPWKKAKYTWLLLKKRVGYFHVPWMIHVQLNPLIHKN